MGVPNSQLTTNFVAKYRLITVFFKANYQQTVNPIGTLLHVLWIQRTPKIYNL